MEKLTLTILTIGSVLSLTSERAVTSDAGISLSDNAIPLEPKIKEIRIEKVSALTGAESPTEMKSLDICGTDLGTMTGGVWDCNYSNFVTRMTWVRPGQRVV
jgi:hypothetical protein